MPPAPHARPARRAPRWVPATRHYGLWHGRRQRRKCLLQTKYTGPQTHRKIPGDDLDYSEKVDDYHDVDDTVMMMLTMINGGAGNVHDGVDDDDDDGNAQLNPGTSPTLVCCFYHVYFLYC